MREVYDSGTATDNHYAVSTAGWSLVYAKRSSGTWSSTTLDSSSTAPSGTVDCLQGNLCWALRELGCDVISLPAEVDLPDSVFVEDVALVFDEYDAGRPDVMGGRNSLTLAEGMTGLELNISVNVGEEGKLFHPLAYTKTFAMIGATLLAVTVVPALCTFLLATASG